MMCLVLYIIIHHLCNTTHVTHILFLMNTVYYSIICKTFKKIFSCLNYSPFLLAFPWLNCKSMNINYIYDYLKTLTMCSDLILFSIPTQLFKQLLV